MRTLHIDTGLEMRGGQHQVILLLEALAARGEEFTLLAAPRGKLFHAARDRGWNVRPAGLQPMWRWARRAQVVHAHDARGHTLAAIASPTPLVVSRRVVFPVQSSALSRWKYGRASAFLAVSQAVAQQLEAAGIPRARIFVVPDAIRKSVVQWAWDPHAPVVALASQDPAKGSDLVREAAKLLPDIAVKFSSDLAADLPHCRAFVYVTRSEGLGSAALLAMSMGVPVVASRVGGLAEIFEHGVSGLYVENSAGLIADAIRRVTVDPDLAERLGAAGRELVEGRFTVERLAERTLEIYRSIR